MRWYKICLAEGRLPFFCNEIMHPVGVPLGNFSPLHIQTLLYIPLSIVLDNDVLCFNLIWLTGILFTGLGTFALIRQVLRDRACAAFGGLVAMLSGPMLQHAQAHLELVFLGGVPLFLAAWIRFVDQPCRRRLALAMTSFLLVAVCAGYYTPLASVPAALYVAIRALRALRYGRAGWLLGRLGWLALFALLILPPLLMLFGNQIWSVAHGYALDRSMFEFREYGAPLWTYFAPTQQHLLGRALPFDFYAAEDFTATPWEGASYLGLASWLLIGYALVRRCRIPRARFWWVAFAVLVVLGCGAEGRLGPWRFPLPAAWLKSHVAAFRPIRVPARFNLLTAVIAALWAAAGLRQLKASVVGRTGRIAVYTAVAAIAVLDLANVPFPTAAIPPQPACYAWLRQHDPGATLLEIPQYPSGGSYLYAICAYWQSWHRGRTNAGYCGQANVRYDNLISRNTPFLAKSMVRPDYLAANRRGPARVNEIVSGVSFADYVWLFATVHRYDYILLHEWHDEHFDPPSQGRLKSVLLGSKVFEDQGMSIFARARLRPPARPVILPTDGWRPTWEGRPCRVAERVARLAVFNPRDEWELRLTLEVKALRHRRIVRLVSGTDEFARWTIEPDRFAVVQSPAFRLSSGLQELRLVSDGEEQPIQRRELAWETDRAPYSLRVTAVGFHVR
jgi:hypothetical protein